MGKPAPGVCAVKGEDPGAVPPGHLKEGEAKPVRSALEEVADGDAVKTGTEAGFADADSRKRKIIGDIVRGRRGVLC